MKKWINVSGARCFLEQKYINILNREAQLVRARKPFRMMVRTSKVRNTRRTRKLYRLALMHLKRWNNRKEAYSE